MGKTFLTDNYQKFTGRRPNGEEISGYRKIYHNKKQQINAALRLRRISNAEGLLLEEYLAKCHPDEVQAMRVCSNFARDIEENDFGKIIS